ncbi:iron-containing alcohol dehydrogenase [Caproiciproducens galactitolivorans]|uniref:Iron-containing alcohol dehydrogenase n=1 Tax=Caproiciproducens galactitolivorans TaxID=642589 RepID=A0ABT4BV68_9FIRM|nr:iron-containing alcohol dehydrogenase [Caproiciproducens galactitolivorans]MCY1714782.1 iron-containing alcohol dehydrogenase [Caproiciproducens galactitolivorans]
MMRPMKLAGSELMFGEGCLEYIKSVPCKKAFIVVGGKSMERSGILAKVEGYFHEIGAQTTVFQGVEPDPCFSTVKKGADKMKEFQPDMIVALGGGSAMDAAKTMWVYYEHPELTTLEEVLTAQPFPKLREKARFMCIPSTSGTASEVSRSVVISDDATGMKHGLGNMEMMPDIAICDPEVTATMPPHITAETGMDALTHAVEALVSNRANYLSDILARAAAIDIVNTLPKACENGKDMAARETMLNASMTAGLAFTNVSLGIVHSMAHTLGGFFHVSHGLGDAVVLPYIIDFNSGNPEAKAVYDRLAKDLGGKDLAEIVRNLNKKIGIPSCVKEVVKDEAAYTSKLEEMAESAKADGCTKTNPIIPTIPQFVELFKKVYQG